MPWPLTALAVIAALSPVPLGSGRPLAVGLWCLCLAATAAFMPLRQMDHRAWRALYPLLVLFAAWGGLSLFHATALGGLSADATERALPIPYLAWASAGLPLAIALAFLIAFTQCMDRSSGGRLLRVLALIVAGHAALAFLLHILTPGEIFGYRKLQHEHSLTGTFLNRNTAATFFGIGVVVWLARTMTFFEKMLPAHGSLVARISWMHQSSRRKLLRSVCCLGLCAAALLATGSRAGVMSTAIGCGAVLLISAPRLSLNTSRLNRYTLIAFGILVCIGLFLIAGDVVAYRLSRQGLFDALRYAIYTDSLNILGDHFWLGTGSGTFENIYPAYRSAGAAASGIVNKAHSTPLEIAVTLGVPFTVLLFSVAGIVMVRLARAARRAPDGSSLLTAAFGAACLITFHAFFDYSIQIAGCALLASTVLGAGYARTLAATPDILNKPSA